MNKQEFIQLVLPGAQKAYKEHNILPSLTIAQAALESAWGSSAPGNMLFGIKWTGGCGYDKQLLWTQEYINGQWVKVQDWFRKYDTLADSVEDHARFLVKNSRYAPVLQATNYKDACRVIQECGYATDPNYTTSLISIIESNNLQQYDVKEAVWVDWKTILAKAATDPTGWEKGITTAVNAANADGSLGDLEIFKYLPQLIEKIYNMKG